VGDLQRAARLRSDIVFPARAVGRVDLVGGIYTWAGLFALDYGPCILDELDGPGSVRSLSRNSDVDRRSHSVAPELAVQPANLRKREERSNMCGYIRTALGFADCGGLHLGFGHGDRLCVSGMGLLREHTHGPNRSMSCRRSMSGPRGLAFGENFLRTRRFK